MKKYKKISGVVFAIIYDTANQMELFVEIGKISLNVTPNKLQIFYKKIFEELAQVKRFDYIIIKEKSIKRVPKLMFEEVFVEIVE